MRKKKLLVTLAGVCVFVAASAQEYRFGVNVFPVTSYQIKYDKPYFILPDYTSVKVDESLRITARKSLLTGFYFRVNWGHLMMKTELNYFNRFFDIGDTTIPQEYSNDPYRVTVRYMTFEVPLYVGYTFKPNGKFRVTPFAGVSTEIGKLKPLIPPILKTFDDKEGERVYGELFDQKALMPPTLVNYTAGVEFIYYGILLQLTAKQNATPLFRNNPNNANPTSLTMLECTVGFGIHKGGFAHSILRRWK